MTIHQYSIYERKLTRHELIDFKEEEKIFRRENGYPTIIKKTAIGKIDTRYFPHVYLLEPDEEKAKEILLKYYETKLEITETRYTADKEALTMILKNLQPAEKGKL